MSYSLSLANWRNSFFDFGIRQKLLLILLLVLLSTLTISGWLALKKEKTNTLKEINQRGNDISRFVAKSLAFSVVGYDYHTLQLLTDEITSSEDIGFAQVRNRKGTIMATSGAQVGISQEHIVLFREPILLENEVVGELELGLSIEKTIQALEDKKYTVLKREAFLVLLIALGEFVALSFFIVRPVRLMSTSLKTSVDENGLIVGKLPVTSEDEFGQLAKSFNTLSQQLNEANLRLQSKVELADQRLIETNQQLMRQSEELKQMNENFRRLSITDALTGLCNRRHFEELMRAELEAAVRYNHTNSLLIIDVDHFKSINDNHGHPCGDKVLKDIAAMLKQRMRKSDHICRIGGEEFAALCKRADIDAALNIAEELRTCIADHAFTYGDEVLKVTISVGIDTLTPDHQDPDSEVLYRHADKAVYYSKQNGRNRVTHFQSLDDAHA